MGRVVADEILRKKCFGKKDICIVSLSSSCFHVQFLFLFFSLSLSYACFGGRNQYLRMCNSEEFLEKSRSRGREYVCVTR